MDTYEQVSFVSLDDGDDLIVSFLVIRPDDPSDGRSITLLRDRKWEHLLPDQERGVKVADEGAPDEEEWQDNLLESVRVSDSAVESKSMHFERKLDVRKLGATDLQATRELLKKMNFDRRFILELA
jgi:hypothetical protein